MIKYITRFKSKAWQYRHFYCQIRVRKEEINAANTDAIQCTGLRNSISVACYKYIALKR